MVREFSTPWRLQDSSSRYDNETWNQEVKGDFVILDGKGEMSGEEAVTEMTFQQSHGLGLQSHYASLPAGYAERQAEQEETSRIVEWRHTGVSRWFLNIREVCYENSHCYHIA